VSKKTGYCISRQGDQLAATTVTRLSDDRWQIDDITHFDPEAGPEPGLAKTLSRSGPRLSWLLQEDFLRIIEEPNQHFLFQVETNIMFTFRNGTTEPLGFIVNPLVFSYGLPLLFGLVMGSNVSWLRKAVIMAIGYVVILGVQIWGVVFQSLKMLSFNFGQETHAIVLSHGITDSVVALGYQLGTLILPALAPIFVWVLTNRPLVEQFVGWNADQLKKDAG